MPGIYGLSMGTKKNLCVIKAGVKQQMKHLYTCFLEAFFLLLLLQYIVLMGSLDTEPLLKLMVSTTSILKS